MRVYCEGCKFLYFEVTAIDICATLSIDRCIHPSNVKKKIKHNNMERIVERKFRRSPRWLNRKNNCKNHKIND